MIITSLDFETSGLDRKTDRITEVGAIVWSTKVNRAMETASFLVKCEVPVSKEVEALTGISNAMLKKFGVDEEWAIEETIRFVEISEAIIGQNVIQFDKHFLYNAAERLGMTVPERLWIDTRYDLPPSVESKTLAYMAADHGFLNPFLHNAVGDGLTVLRIVSMYDINEIVERAKSPIVILKALVDFDTNTLAKKRKYSWYAPAKLWYKVVKEMDVDKEVSEAPFDISVVKDIPVETLWYS